MASYWYPALRRRVRDEPPLAVPLERADLSFIPFVAVSRHNTGDDDDNEAKDTNIIEWAFFQGKEQIESGSFDFITSTIEKDVTDFLAVCKRTKEGDGHLVSYGSDVLVKVDNALMNTSTRTFVQSSLKLCDLAHPCIQRLVDDDFYKIVTLEELCQEQRSKTTSVDSNEGKNVAAGSKHTQIDMIGSCFHWISSRYDGELLTMRRPNHLMTHGPRLLASSPLLNKLRIGTAAPRINQTWDSIDDNTDGVAANLEKLKFVVLDVETHDWADGITYVTRSNCIGRVVEIGWIALDSDGNELTKKRYLLKPHGYQYIQRKAADYHGITTRCAIENGSDSRLVFDEFCRLLQQIPEDGFVIAHSMNHEDGVMGTNLEGSNLEIWNHTSKCCTMKPSAVPELLLRNGFDVTRKFIKLGEFHRMIHPEKMSLRLKAHDALADARMAWGVFRYVEQQNRVKSIVWTPFAGTDPFGKRPRHTH